MGRLCSSQASQPRGQSTGPRFSNSRAWGEAHTHTLSAKTRWSLRMRSEHCEAVVTQLCCAAGLWDTPALQSCRGTVLAAICRRVQLTQSLPLTQQPGHGVTVPCPSALPFLHSVPLPGCRVTPQMGHSHEPGSCCCPSWLGAPRAAAVPGAVSLCPPQAVSLLLAQEEHSRWHC